LNRGRVYEGEEGNRGTLLIVKKTKEGKLLKRVPRPSKKTKNPSQKNLPLADQKIRKRSEGGGGLEKDSGNLRLGGYRFEFSKLWKKEKRGRGMLTKGEVHLQEGKNHSGYLFRKKKKTGTQYRSGVPRGGGYSERAVLVPLEGGNEKKGTTRPASGLR